jgi:hypothetical protein
LCISKIDIPADAETAGIEGTSAALATAVSVGVWGPEADQISMAPAVSATAAIAISARIKISYP